MAKAYASISITSLNDGASGKNSDEVRYIYIKSSAGNKPSKPSGTSKTVPDGWSLFPPSRGDGDTIYVSMAITTYSQDNIATYGSWSDPVAWTGEYIPFVQWKWGASITVNPDEDVSVVTVGNSIITYVDTAFAYKVNTAEWSSTIPDRVEGCPYLWKRELDYGTNTWLYYCVQGGNGLSGRYMSIGYKVTGGNSITFSGLDQDGLPNLNAIQLSVNGENIILPSSTFTIGAYHSRYILTAVWDDSGVGSLKICYLEPYSDGSSYSMKWIADDLSEIENGYAIADIKVSSDVPVKIISVNMFDPRSIEEYENAYFMSIMNDLDINDINVVAKALDVERVFQRVAMLEAFVDRLYANYIKLTGSIYGGAYDKNGNNASSGVGFYLGSDGMLKAVSASFINANVSGKFLSSTFRTMDSDTQISISSSLSESDHNVVDINGLHNGIGVAARLYSDENGIQEYIDCNIYYKGKTYTRLYSPSSLYSRGQYLISERSNEYLQIDEYGLLTSPNQYNTVFGNIYESPSMVDISYVKKNNVISSTSVAGISISKETAIRFADTNDGSKFGEDKMAFIGTVSYRKLYFDTTETIQSTETDKKYISIVNKKLKIESSDSVLLDYEYFISISMDISISSTAGIETMNIIPKEDNLYDVGSPAIKFRNGYINTLIGNVNQEGDTIHKVWGAVAN